jgi:hypothetical protein
MAMSFSGVRMAWLIGSGEMARSTMTNSSVGDG